ncbi:MAG: MFS transporter [Polyangiales bacterium]
MLADRRAQTDAVSPDYFRAFRADVLSMAGDWFTFVAMSQLAASDPHPSASLLAVAASHTLPRWALAPWAGALADRLDRRAILVRVQAIRAVIVALMALLATRRATDATLIIHGLHLARMCLGAFADSALRAALPTLVSEPRLRWAHARTSVAWSVLLCFGTAFGGIAVATIGVALAFAIDALSYALSAALYARVSPLAAELETRASSGSWSEFAQALRAHPSFAVAMFAKIPAAIAQGAIFVSIALRAQHAPIRAALAIAAMHVARGLGAAVGAVAIRPRSTHDAGLAFAALGLAFGVGFTWISSLEIAIALLFFFGVFTSATWVHSSAAVATLAPASVRGRASATELAAQGVAQWLGSALACTALGAPLSLLAAALALVALVLHHQRSPNARSP